MTRFCLKCGNLSERNNPFPWLKGEAHAHRPGCPGGRVIPIATLCSEPTVIDESDLAPGMVVVAVDDERNPCAFLCSPDAFLSAGTGHQLVNAFYMVHMNHGVSAEGVRRASGVRPC